MHHVLLVKGKALLGYPEFNEETAARRGAGSQEEGEGNRHPQQGARRTRGSVQAGQGTSPPESGSVAAGGPNRSITVLG